MNIEINATRIGTECDLPAIVVAIQIGVTRIGTSGRVIPRNARGRFVSVRKLVEVTLDVATLTDCVCVPLPAKRLASAAVRAVATMTALVITGAIRPVVTLAQRLLRWLSPMVRTSFACLRASWRARTVVFPCQLDGLAVELHCRALPAWLACSAS